MFGPKPIGFWSANSQTSWDILIPGKRFEVIREFSDFDKITHPVGETWLFAGSGFLPYDAGLSLFVQTIEGEWHIRMQLNPEEQKSIVDELEKYIRLIP
jgi:hypothetical protein